MSQREIVLAPGESVLVRVEGESGEIPSIAAGGRRKGSTRKTRKNRKEAAPQEGGGKRKASGFMKFSKEQREKIGKEDAKMRSDVVAMAKEIGKRWRALSDAEKARY